MSRLLEAIDFPLHGTRLIEASAGTGKTWTIAALYLRLVLGHGEENAYARPLAPGEILVMTFTRAATQELSNRIRERLVQAAGCFRGDAPPEHDFFLREVIEAHEPGPQRERAAHRLTLAAESMDEAAVFTIDAWCQRMLREHAFDSGCLFDEELLGDETALFKDAVRDYWRQEVYRLDAERLALLRRCWPDMRALQTSIRDLVGHAALLEDAVGENAPAAMESVGAMLTRLHAHQRALLARLKQGWPERAARMESWIAQRQAATPKTFNGNKMRAASLAGWFEGLRNWAGDADAVTPEISASGWFRLTPDGLLDACNKGVSIEVPEDFDAMAALKAQLDAVEPLKFALMRHAAVSISRRMSELKARSGQFSFADMLSRLERALAGPGGAMLRERIVRQFPVALIDEFQDTSPSQYAIFDALYRVADNDDSRGLFLIGDPKQSIYGFRGADIHSYLAARRATAPRHYILGTNYRSTGALVNAVNRLFLHAEGGAPAHHAGHPGGAFRFRSGEDNPLPFEAVDANGLPVRLVEGAGGRADRGEEIAEMPALTVWYSDTAGLNRKTYQARMAACCAERIVGILNDPRAGFEGCAGFARGFTRIAPADIAILVRDRIEAQAVRRALQVRGVASVYLSDKDSVIGSAEAADVLRWLQAVASPLDAMLARAAYATSTAGLPLAALAELAVDELAWERRIEELRFLQGVWQRQGVLAMLRRMLHVLDLPARLLARTGGERQLTNLLHIAELLQQASNQLDGEQALIRWLAEQIDEENNGGGRDDERILRLESDAGLVKVITVHKSKGLEYRLVFLPFAVAARPATRRRRSFLDFVDHRGSRQIDLAMSDAALEAMEKARLAEDLRLLYVALTRACHALWLGVASIDEKLHESAFGYLAGGGAPVKSEQLPASLEQLRGDCPDIVVERVADTFARTMLARQMAQAPLEDGARYEGVFETDWSVGSFTSLTRMIGNAPAPSQPLEARLLDEIDETMAADIAGEAIEGVAMPGRSVDDGAARDDAPDDGMADDAAMDNTAVEDDATGDDAGENQSPGRESAAGETNAVADRSHRVSAVPAARPDADAQLSSASSTGKHSWHAFPRGPLPGQFIHEQLEWLAGEGFDLAAGADFETMLAQRCQRAGWSNRFEETAIWLKAIAATPLGGRDGPGVCLAGLGPAIAEMEFWFPSAHLDSRALDELCQELLLDAAPRPRLPQRELHGMLKGFIDMVFEHEGRYWILDYKTNALGADDAAYHAPALTAAMAAHRYDIQGAIYLYALDRLLASRLDEDYDPASQLGGALFLFLRGIGNAGTRGCHLIEPSQELLDGMHDLLNGESP